MEAVQAWRYSVPVTILAAVIGRQVLQRAARRSREQALAQRAAEKRAQRDAVAHPKLREAMAKSGPDAEERELELLLCTGSELRYRMAHRQVTCEEVTLAFCRRCYELGGWRTGGDSALNCVAEENYDEALELARAADRRPAADWADMQRYPLLGIPISVKDQLVQKGFDATMGAAARCFRWGRGGAPDDGLHLKLLLEAGAIPIVRSTTQQALMLPESANNIWGTARNPYNPLRTPGGSSGGEGGLIGGRCTPLGIGTDIGGSVRIPCHFCGIYGFKPTQERITKRGVSVARKNERNGQTIIKGVAGPMAHCVEDLAAVMRAWLRPSMWDRDPGLPRMAFDNATYRGVTLNGIPQSFLGKRQLRVACIKTDGWFHPCAAVERAVLEAAEALRGAGHDVLDVVLPPRLDGWKASALYLGIMGADGNMFGFVEGLEGERLHEMYSALKTISDLPNFIRPAIRAILRTAGESRKAAMLAMSRSGGWNVRQFYEIVADVEEFRKEWSDFFREAGFDVVLLPSLALPAFKHGESKVLNQACSYTFLMNLLGWAAGNCPVTQVRPDEQTYPMERLPANQRDSMAKLAAECMKDSAGLPVGVQLAAPPFEDELALFAMSELERELPFTGLATLGGLASRL